MNRFRERFRSPFRSLSFGTLFPGCCAGGAILIAVLFRVSPICSGLPYIDYIDEGYVLHQSIDLLNHRTLDTRWYGYPSFPAYLTAAGLLAYAPIYHVVHGHGFDEDLPKDRDIHTPAGDNYDLISPPALIVAGRSAAISLSVLTVLLAGALARKLAGDRAGGLALILVATCPALVSRGSNVIVDTFATFFALWSLYFCAALVQSPAVVEGRMKWLATGAGAAAGFAFASKYTVAVVFAAVVFIIATLPAGRSLRFRLLALAGAGLCLTTALTAPAVFWRSAAVFREVATTAHNYTIMTSTPGYFGQAVSRSELGWPLFIAGSLGLLLMLRSSSDRPLALGWMVFGILLLGLFIAKPFQPFRNLLPLVPPFCIAAALALDRLLQWCDHKKGAAFWKSSVALAIAAIVTSAGFSSFGWLQKRISHRDSRIKAIDWLCEHVRKDDRVLAIAELAFLPRELDRIGARVRVAPWSEALTFLPQKEFDYLVSGAFKPRSATSSLTPRAKFGKVPTPMPPYLWRSNDERILVFARPALANAPP